MCQIVQGRTYMPNEKQLLAKRAQLDLPLRLRLSFKLDWIRFHHTFLIPEYQSDYLIFTLDSPVKLV